MTLIEWVVMGLIWLGISTAIVMFVNSLVLTADFRKNMINGNVMNENNIKYDLFLFILFITILVFFATISYRETVKSNYEKIEIFNEDYLFYTTNLENEKLDGEGSYNLIKDIRNYNQSVLNFQTSSEKIIGNADLKSDIASLKLINIE